MKEKNKTNIYLFLFLTVTISLIICLFLLVKYYNLKRAQQFFLEYKNYFIEFRQPIYESFRIPIIPNENLLNISVYTLASGFYENLTIIIFEFDDNQATALEAAEIVSKIKNILYFEIPTYNINVNILKIRRNLSEISFSSKEYYIFLKSYLISNETYIKIHNINLIEITGKNLKEFDLATIRFLISFLNIMKEIYR